MFDLEVKAFFQDLFVLQFALYFTTFEFSRLASGDPTRRRQIAEIRPPRHSAKAARIRAVGTGVSIPTLPDISRQVNPIQISKDRLRPPHQNLLP